MSDFELLQNICTEMSALLKSGGFEDRDADITLSSEAFDHVVMMTKVNQPEGTKIEPSSLRLHGILFRRGAHR